MIENGIRYSIEPSGREKGCFDSVVKLGKRNVIRTINNAAKMTHGYTLHATISHKDNTFRRKDGIFNPAPIWDIKHNILYFYYFHMLKTNV